MQGAHRLLSVVWCALTVLALNPLVYGWTFTGLRISACQISVLQFSQLDSAASGLLLSALLYLCAVHDADKARPPGRSLQPVAASDSASQVWQQGRATWTNPSADFISQLDEG